MQKHLVRIGALGQIGQFVPRDAMHFRRGTRVICRSDRGLEIGTVLTASRETTSMRKHDGTILRKAAVEDELLWTRIEKNRSSAYQECQRLLDERDVAAALIDIELLFDGRSIYFYFLGTVTPEVEQLTAELAQVYEARVQLRQFTDALTQGCGPGCGTEEAAGCGAGCGSCAIAGACATRK